jgi:hypothetical protein
VRAAAPAAAAPAEAEAAPPIRVVNLAWVALALAAMAAVIASDDLWALNFTHVFAGVLWTGIDLFLGFVVGPILRRAPLPARRAIICRLMPKTLFLMPTLAIVTGTAGYVLAARVGFLDVGYPQYWWVLAALIILAVLTVQGLGILLPTNLAVYFELRRARPDEARIGRLMRRYVRVVALQGMLQVAIVAVMARFATGI